MAMPVNSGPSARFGRRYADFAIDRASPAFDIAMVALLFSAILFNSLIGPLSPVIVFAITPIYIALRWERVAAVLSRCWPILLLPLFSLTSVLWSDHPATTLYYGFLYLLTVLPAVFLGAGAERLAMLKGIFVAFAIYGVASILFGRWVFWGGPGGVAFAGLLGSKNASGDAAALTILISTTILIWARKPDRLRWLALALLAICIGVFCLWASKATGALVAAIVSLPCLFMWIYSRQLDLAARSSIFVVAVVILAVLLATFDYWMVPLFEAVLENSGKDAGLTGRDFLWAKADSLILERPLLGNGYNAFWVVNNLDAEYLWREMGIPNKKGFNFHHTPRDILVDLGYVGLTLFAAIAAYCAVNLLLRTMKSPDYTGIFCCALLVFESPRIFFEQVGFQNMHFSTVILFMIFAYGLRSAKLPPLSSR